MDDQSNVANNCRMDLISSLFGPQIALDSLTDDQTPAKFEVNYACPHPIFIRKMCTQCGQEIDNSEIRTLPFRYIYPNLTLSAGETNRIRDKNLRYLLTRKKLHLVLDLDHTLVHQRVPCKLTIEDKKFLKSQKHRLVHPDENFIEGGSLIELSHGWVKLRPFLRNFLEEASKLFDLTIFTLGGRATSWTITKLLDPDGMYFDNWRVISREDHCGVLDKHKKSLALVLEHENVVVVLDDREKVWEDYKANYIKVIPYNFFSFSSPEDRVYDASPPRESWSQLGGDESEENGVLATVLGKLRAIHSTFYEDDGFGDYGNRDVREVIQRVDMSQKRSMKEDHRRKKKTGRRVCN